MNQLLAGFRYIQSNFAQVAQLTGQHLFLTLVSLAISLAIALPLGVLLARVKELRAPVIGLLSVIYTIPSLSLLVLLIPFFRLGPQTAIIALVAYAQLVLVRNILLGLTNIDPAVLEAARGMGMNSWQLFIRVELPLAMPLIVSGVRIATLSIIGIGTIAAYINAGGLGTLLFRGLTTGQRGQIVAGCIAVATLALLTNQLLRMVERRVAMTVRDDG
jgi:osmoprotectant transport system permease protein